MNASHSTSNGSAYAPQEIMTDNPEKHQPERMGVAKQSLTFRLMACG
jgi:hypothetical protein